MIHTISQWIAERIVSRSEKSISVNVVAYGLEVVLGELVKLIVFFFLGWLCNCLPQMVVLVVSYMLTRIVTGGPHCSSYMRCLLLGVVSFTPLAILAHFANQMMLSVTILVSVVFTTFVTFRWVPGEWHQRRLKKPKETYRNATIVLLIVAYLLTMVLYLTDQGFWISLGQAIQLGLMWQFLGVTPLGYELVRYADRFMIHISNRFRRKEEIL